MSLLPFILLLHLTASLSWACIVSETDTCRADRLDPAPFLRDFRSQCPVSISSNPPSEVDMSFLDRTITSKQTNGYASVLFYASWCPFSLGMRTKFEILSSLFPQIEHLAIEQSSSLPSVFSRYGIHSLPSILIVNQTSKVRYTGPKDLESLKNFYERTTGLEPIPYLIEDEQTASYDDKRSILQPWKASSLEEITKREPYLILASLFLCLRILLFVSPQLLARFKAFCRLYIPHINVQIFGEARQLFGRILHAIDIRRIWTKLRLAKTRNFHERAKSCRVWASSFASVSLGESSSSLART